MSEPAAPNESGHPRLARRLARWLLPVLVLGTAAGIWQRERIWIWYCAERLERASPDDQSQWANKLVSAGEPAVPTMLSLLGSDDSRVCVAATGAIQDLLASWPVDDGRRLSFARKFVNAEPRFSTPGRSAALDLLPTILATGNVEIARRAKEMVATCAKSESVDVRVQSIAAALRPEVDCLDVIAPLVNDPAADVRRAAVLTLGPVRDGCKPIVSDEQLLHCLHDTDAEVRKFAEMGLRSRGRTTREIRLGRRYTAPDATERQKLLIDLADEENLDASVWLERLTTDADPSVRAGAARLAAERRTDLGGRLVQMSRSDPDATVRRIADYYRRKMLAKR